MNQTGRILEEVKKAVCGKDRVLVWVLTVLLARGHVLLEDIPGVGKTTMALAFSRALGLEYGRVQFTPDVLRGKDDEWLWNRVADTIDCDLPLLHCFQQCGLRA